MSNDDYMRDGDRKDFPLPQRQALYLQVYRILLERIENGTIPTGAYLPNEFDLSREYRVSIGTIRKAIDILVEDKLVHRQQGRGTMVTDERWRESRRRTDRFRTQGGEPVQQWNHEELSYETIAADEIVARQLKLSRGDRAHHVSRLRSAPGAWRIIERIYWPARLIPVESLDPEDRADTDKLIRKFGLVIASVDERLTPVSAAAVDGESLGVAPGAALLRSERVLIDRDGSPFEYRTMLCASEDGGWWSSPA